MLGSWMVRGSRAYDKSGELSTSVRFDFVLVSSASGYSAVSTTRSIYCHLLENSRAKVSKIIISALNFGSFKGIQG